MQYLPWAGALSSLAPLLELSTKRMGVGYLGFSALRAYTLSRNRPLSVLVFVLSIVPIAINLVSTPYPLAICLCERMLIICDVGRRFHVRQACNSAEHELYMYYGYYSKPANDHPVSALLSCD